MSGQKNIKMNFEQLKEALLEGTQLTPEMLENAGWEIRKIKVSEDPSYIHAWILKDLKIDRMVYVDFAEGDSGLYFVRLGGQMTFAFSSRCMESLCTFLLLQFPHIEFESPSDILKMLGV